MENLEITSLKTSRQLKKVREDKVAEYFYCPEYKEGLIHRYFDNTGSLIFENYNFYPAYKQTDIQKWLREIHAIRVFPEQKSSGYFGFVIYILNPEIEKRAGKPWIRLSYFTQSFEKYEDALDEGLYNGTKLLIETVKQ